MTPIVTPKQPLGFLQHWPSKNGAAQSKITAHLPKISEGMNNCSRDIDIAFKKKQPSESFDCAFLKNCMQVLGTLMAKNHSPSSKN